MTYYHQLTKEQAEEAFKLPSLIFQKKFLRPQGCGFHGALDKKFGCHFLFGQDIDRISINKHCKKCPCGKEEA